MNVTEHIEFIGGLSPGSEGDIGFFLQQVQDLPPFLRALLVADGTVTTLLGAYFGETISVMTGDQGSRVLDSALPALGLAAGDEAFQRQVVLRGGESGIRYATAISILNPQALPGGLFDALIDENVGMGEVLRNSARGSYREVLSVRRQGEFVDRTYLVYLGGRPAIMITESFDPAQF